MKTTSGISYLENRPAQSDTNTTLVFLHGIGGNAHSFAPQLASFGRNWRCIAWNMPGYADSRPLESMSFANLAASLDTFLAELALERVHLVGHSIGGMLAQEYHARFAARVASLSLLATTAAFGGADDSFREAFVRQRLAPLDQGLSMADMAQQFVPEITGPDTPAAVIADATRSLAEVPEDTWRKIIACLVTFNRRDHVAHINVPTCLIAGALDNNAPAKTMHKFAQRVADAEFHCLEDAGHLVNLEQPAAVDRIIQRFVAAHT